MGLLEDQIEDDAIMSFLDVDGFAETVVYVPGSQLANYNATPRTYAGRSISAVVRRMVPEAAFGIRQDVQPRLLVIVANSATLGISSSELDTGGDKLILPYRIGEAASMHPVKQQKGSETNDPGCLYLEI